MTTHIGPEYHNDCEIFYIMIESGYQAIVRWPKNLLPAAVASWLNTYTDDIDITRYLTTDFIDDELRDRDAFVTRYTATAEGKA